MLVRFADSQRLGERLPRSVVGVALFVVATATDRPKARRLPFVALGLAAVAALPAAMPTIGETLLRAHEKLWVTLGSARPRLPRQEPRSALAQHGVLVLRIARFRPDCDGDRALCPRSAPRGGPARGARARSSPARVRTLARDGGGVRPVPREVLHVPSRACGCDMGSCPTAPLAGLGGNSDRSCDRAAGVRAFHGEAGRHCTPGTRPDAGRLGKVSRADPDLDARGWHGTNDRVLQERAARQSRRTSSG